MAKPRVLRTMQCFVGLISVAGALSASPPTTAAPRPSVAPPTQAGGASTTTNVATTSTPASSSAAVTIPSAEPAIAIRPAYVDNPLTGREKAAAYAYVWATTTNPAFALFYRGRASVPSDNPVAVGRAVETATWGELDCTHYMSQALRVGGFAFTPEWSYSVSRHTSTIAWVRASGPQGLPATFVRLGRFTLMAASGTHHGDPPPTGIQIGDIVVWDLNDRNKTMFVDHELMVTEVTGNGSSWADIHVSYHTYDHRNRAMDEYQDVVAPEAPRAKLYVFHVNYPS